MRNSLLGLSAVAALLAASATGASAQASQSPQLIFGVDRAGDQPTLDNVQFLWGGRNYCWYDGGWRGPGFYWCGYAWRSGLGWGGGYGWRGWRAGHPEAWYRSRPEYRGWRGFGHAGGPRGDDHHR